MKKILALILVPCMLLGTLFLLSSCSNRVKYDNAEAYTAGAFEIEAEIHSVEIYWEGKYVSVSGSLTEKIKAEEGALNADGESLRDLADEESLHYLVEDGVLKIYPCASGERIDELEKSLFIELPMTMANNLQKLEIRAMSDTSVYLQMMKPKDLKVYTDGGNVSFDGTLDRVHVETETGNFVATSTTLTDLEFISYTGSASITAHLYGFTAVMRNEDGTFTSEFEASQNGNLYTYGTQETIFIFDTAGTVEIKDKPLFR